MNPDTLPPHDLEAERCLLGSLILCDTDRAIFAEVRAAVRAESFFQPDYQILFQTLCEMIDSGKPIDAVLLHSFLSSSGRLEEIGGAAQLAQVIHSVPTYAHYAGYAAIVREKFLKRELIRRANKLIADCHAPAFDDNAAELANGMARDALHLSQGNSDIQVYRIEDVLHEVITRRDNGEIRQISTGLVDLDKYVGGLRRGEKHIIGAEPGMGKSALVKQLAFNVANSGLSVGLISVEEGRQKIAENLLSMRSGVLNNHIAFDRCTSIEWQNVVNAMPSIAKLNIYVIDSVRSLSRIVAAAHRLALRDHCEVIFVDHLHIIDPETRGGNSNREREISKISAELKWVWKELNVAGVECAQLNRAGRERPTLNRLRDSGSLGQDGDTILMLYRDDYYRKSDSDFHVSQMDNTLEVHVVKNKSGPGGKVDLYFDEARQHIANMTHAYQEIV